MSVKELVSWYFEYGKNGFWKDKLTEDGKHYNYDEFLDMLSDEHKSEEFDKLFMKGIKLNSRNGETLSESIEAVFEQLTLALAIKLVVSGVVESMLSDLIPVSKSSRWN